MERDKLNSVPGLFADYTLAFVGKYQVNGDCVTTVP